MSRRLRRLAFCACFFLAAPLLAGFAGTDLFLPNVGRQAGIFPSNWYTTVWIYNPGTDAATARVYLLVRNTANPTPPSVEVTVAAGDTTKLENVVESLFHQQVFGALRVTCDTQKLVVTSRTYSKGAAAGEPDSVGQDFAGVPASFAIGNGESTQVLGVHQTEPASSSDYRFNFGFVETTGHSANVTVTAFDETGFNLGSATMQVREFSQRQLAFKDYFPTVSSENVRLQVAVTSGSGRIIAYGSGIANASQDPTTFEMQYKDSLLGISTVQHDATLTGNGTAAAPLGIPPGTASGQVLTTIGGEMSATGQVSALAAGLSVAWQAPAPQPPSGPAGGVLAGTYPNPAIAAGQVVTGINGLKDGVTLAAGPNTTITPSGQILTIASNGLSLPYQTSASTATNTAAFEIDNNGAGYGLVGTSSTGMGVNGRGLSQPGVWGTTFSDTQPGVWGSNYGGKGLGVKGTTDSGVGVEGVSQSGVGVGGLSPTGTGVEGDSHSAVNAGVYGYNTLGGPGAWGYSSSGYGIEGQSDTSTGVFGISTSATGVNGISQSSVGVKGESHSTVNAGVYGYNTAGGRGAWAYSPSGYGVEGQSDTNIGVYGISTSRIGIWGNSGSPISGGPPSTWSIGVRGDAGPGIGVLGLTSSGTAVYGWALSSGFAGYFAGTTYASSLGVGTMNPLAPLHVHGSTTLGSGAADYFGQAYTGASLAALSSGSWATGLLVDSDIVGQRSIVSVANVTASDARIKNIIGPSDGAADLATLEQLQVTDYTYKDAVKMGTRPQKKVVAQQVEQVYPQAVRQRREFIPDVYAMAAVTTTADEWILHLDKKHGLAVGDAVKLIDARDGESNHQVLRVVDDRTFTVAAGDAPTPDRLFVYGRQVDDFRVVDYEALAMLNVSATQELVRRMDEQDRSQRRQIDLLTERLARLEARLAPASPRSSR